MFGIKRKKEKTPAKDANMPVRGKKACTQVTKRKAAQTAKTGQKRAVQRKPEGKKIFEGATEISMTENKIAVTRSTKKNASGSYSASTTREYHDRTPATMKALNDVLNDRSVKKITVKLK